jgi:hypothetical protein
MAKRYFIHVVPTDGPTLKSDTRREWMYGADFTVVKTDYMPFQHTWREQKRGFKFHLTRQDVVDAEARYGVRFDLTFIFRTVEEHFEALAEDSYGAAQSLDLLTRGQ